MNDITSFFLCKRTVTPLIALASQEPYQADELGNYTQLWEISQPVANVYNLDKTAFAMAFGDFSGSAAVNYTVTLTVDDTGTHYTWVGSDSSTGTGLLTTTPIALPNGVFFKFSQVVDWQGTSYYVGGENWKFSVYKSTFAPGAGYQRWSVAPYLNGMFFTNPSTQIKWLNGSTVNNIGWATQNIPSGKYLCMFMGRLVVGQPTYQGQLLNNGIMWSDVNNFMTFDTQLFTNEADQYVFDQAYNNLEIVDGVTGIGVMGTKKLLVYTAGSIYLVTYIGLPLIMQRETLSDKVGCAYPYSLVVSQNIHAFIGQDNFYILPADGVPKQIGDRVWGAFYQNLSTDPRLRYNTHGYIDVNRREIWWVYCSTASTGDFDRKVGYNYVSDTWQFADATEHSFLHCRLPSGGTVIADDSRIIDTVTDIIASVGNPTSTQEVRLYGQTDRKVSIESTTPDQPVGPIYIETADIIYDPAKMLAVDGMDIHADYDTKTCIGVLVEVATRNNVSDPINWVPPPDGKLWTKNLAGTRYGYPRARGRIFRYRFTFVKAPNAVAITYAQFYFWNEFVQGLRNNSDDK